jgi:protoporphyrinogen oxidase
VAGREVKIAVVGGGLMGLALAHRLAGPDTRVMVLDRDAQPGGLTTWHDYGGFTWDRFYHVILPSDTHLLGLLRAIGLGDRLRWQRTLTGFFVDRAFHSMSSNVEFLRFPPLSLWSKVRLAATILYCSRLSDWRALESVPVGDWLRRLSGRATYEKIWLPLLLAKLGQDHERVSAVFIWSYIKRMFSARDSSASKEQLGHVDGGYRTVFDRLTRLVAERGGETRFGVDVSRIEPHAEGGLAVTVGGQREHFDKVVFTAPVDALRRVADPSLVRTAGGADVEYLGVICYVLVTKEPLVPYYIVNIADDRVPFTGIIGMSNLTGPSQTGGYHLTYLPKYVHSGDPLLKAPDTEIDALFRRGLDIMFPDLPRRGLVTRHINRAVKVQPLQVLGYSRLVPTVETLHPDLYVLNTSQFTHTTLNNNEVVGAVDAFVRRHGSELGGPPGSDRAGAALAAAA